MLELEALHSILADETVTYGTDVCQVHLFAVCIPVQDGWIFNVRTGYMQILIVSALPSLNYQSPNLNQKCKFMEGRPTRSGGAINWIHLSQQGKQRLDVREAVGAPLNEGFPLVPAPSMERRATSGILLSRAGVISLERKLTSHNSGKATMLSYLAKSGRKLQ